MHSKLTWAGFVICVSLQISCATTKTSQGPSQSKAATIAADPVDERCSEVLSALQANDFARVVTYFDMKMKSAVSEEQLRRGWQQVSLGKLKSWEVTERSKAGQHERRAVELTFETGKLRGLFAVDPVTYEVAGFRLVPIAPPTTESSSPTHSTF